MMERLHMFKLQTLSPDPACNATILSAAINYNISGLAAVKLISHPVIT